MRGFLLTFFFSLMLGVNTLAYCDLPTSSSGVSITQNDELSTLTSIVPSIQGPFYGSGCCDQGCPLGLFLTAELLYWKWRSDGIPYAAPFTVSEGGLADQSIRRVEPDLDPGVRLSADYVFTCFDNIDLSVEWTHFFSRTNNSVFAPLIRPIWLNQFGNPVASGAEARHRFKLNFLDIDVGRVFCAGQRLLIHPRTGFRAAWIDQRLNVLYSGGDIDPPIDSRNKIDFRGYGLRFGFDTQYKLCYGFSLFANSSIDILWSHFHVNQTETQGVVTRNVIRDRIRSFTPVLEIFAGLMWDSCINWCGCLNYINVHIGWELQHFANLIQFNQYTNIAADDLENAFSVVSHQWGDLGVGGLTLGVTVGF